MIVKIFIPVYYVTQKFPWSKYEVAYKDDNGKIRVLDGKYRNIDVAQARADDLNIAVAREQNKKG